MRSEPMGSIAAIIFIGLLAAGCCFAQTNLAPNPGFDMTAEGNPPCRYTWENDGPCAPEYYVQQYPDAAFTAGLETLNGDNVFAVGVLRDDLAPSSGNPKVNFKYVLSGVAPGEVYAFSTAVRTDALHFETSLRATPKGAGGGIFEAQVIEYGPRLTAPWQRVGLQIEVPEGATAIDFLIYVSGTLGVCDGEPCGKAYFDDIEITRVENLAPNASLDVIAKGNPPCLYTWENDGPCAPEYLVQQQPDKAFRAEIEDRAGNNVFAVEVYRDDLAPTSGNPRAHLKYTLTDVVPGEVYAFSTSVETDGLKFETSLRATPKGAGGAIAGAQVTADGPDQTTPWQRIRLEVPVPEGATSIDFAIYVSGALSSCAGGPCGTAYFDDFSLTRVLDHPFSNVCPEGQYLDWAWTENDCRDLEVDLTQLETRGVGQSLEEIHRTSTGLSTFDPTRIFGGTDTRLGFKPAAFGAAFAAGDFRDDRFDVIGCTEEALQDALTAVEANGGGTVNLPACEIAIDGQIEVPGNTMIQGAGIGRTILLPNEPWNGNRIFNLSEVQHVIIRDLTVDALHIPGTNPSTRGFLTRETDNLLIERVEARRATLNPFDWEVSSNFTLRYSVAADSFTHGFATSDCNPPSSETWSVDQCIDAMEAKYGDDLPLDWYWIASHAIYSNLVADNVKSGVNSHGVLAEIAGNRIVGNFQGSKFSRSRYFWVHHNRYESNEEDLIRLQHVFEFRPPKHVLIYRNRFLANGWGYEDWSPGDPTPNLVTFTFSAPPLYGPALYLIDNDFEGNFGRIQGLAEDPLCAGTDEVLEFPPFVPGMEFDDIHDWHIRYNFAPDLLPATDPICELSNVNTIFPIE